MAEATTRKTSSTTNLIQRIITAAIAIPPVIGLIVVGGVPFIILVTVFATLAVIEMVFILRHRVFFFVLSLFYIGVPLIMLLILRESPLGLVWMAVIVAVTWVTDTMAFVGGRLFGKTPLSPTISPNKTREGAVIGYVSGCLAALLTLAAAGYLSVSALLIPIFGPIAAILGDLFESYIKRRFHTKDSHPPGFNILPGHGGVMDRIDGLLFVSVFCFFFAVLIGLY
ncbi:MAG: phosphatidate cytidylyltransferase [Anaerolineae bacterium]|nr:phosphatidate cytidylyltransferase [Anaerolineae bacterium]NUQ03156.1 phosphatidate cytidylyltransferase [Anaerolineae bacterium]